MATRKLLAWVPRLALLVALAGVACRAETGSDVENLSTDCQAKLATLWTNYTTPTSFPEGCDGQCLLECHATLQDAIYADNARDCPHQEDIVRCFHVSDQRPAAPGAWGPSCAPAAAAHPPPRPTLLQVFSGQWEEYVTECELFAFTGPGDVSLGEGEGEASAGEAAPAPPGEASAGEAAPAPPGEAAPAPPVEAGRRRLAAAEGEGGAINPACPPAAWSPPWMDVHSFTPAAARSHPAPLLPPPWRRRRGRHRLGGGLLPRVCVPARVRALHRWRVLVSDALQRDHSKIMPAGGGSRPAGCLARQLVADGQRRPPSLPLVAQGRPHRPGLEHCGRNS